MDSKLISVETVEVYLLIVTIMARGGHEIKKFTGREFNEKAQF
jgi:hypothetical protein